MAFRDDNFAHNEREKTELRDEVRNLREKNERLARELAEERRKDEEKAAEEALVGRNKWLDRVAGFWESITSPFVALGRWIARIVAFPFVFTGQLLSGMTLQGFMFIVIVLGIFGSVFAMCWHEFEDPRDGYVTGKDFYPEHQECGWEEECTGSGDSRHCSDEYRCHTVPPRWTVDIGYQGQDATWDVEQADYDNIRRGQWFCARDLFHSEPCVEPRQ